MGVFQTLGGWIMKIFEHDAEHIFGVDAITSTEMQQAQDLWAKMIKGQPGWLSADVQTINFAKFICQYTAKKACLDLSVNVNGSPRADFIDKVVKEMVDKSIRDKVEDACGMGGIILKPNGNTNPSGAVDYIMPWNYLITEQTSNGDILGIIFFDRIQKGKVYFTRLEYQHFINGVAEDGTEGRFYEIQNRAYMSLSETTLGAEINLEHVAEWAQLEPSVIVSNVNKALFGYLKMPFNNTIDYSSPEGVSVFANAIEELKGLDIAWSRKASEVADSQHMTFIDEAVLKKQDGSRLVKLPRFVRGLRKGVDSNSTIDEHVATLLTDQRIADLNSILAMISTKCGFSQGQFILDRKSGRLTATQIESDDSETVETITDIRKCLQTAIKDLIYALDKYCDLVYALPDGYVNILDDDIGDEDVFYFKDLLATFEQDRQRAYQLMNQGIYSKRKYLMEYEGFSSEEVDEMMQEIDSEKATGGLFAAE